MSNTDDLINQKALESVYNKVPTQFPVTQQDTRSHNEHGDPIYFMGKRAGWVYCHRLVYALEIGIIPEGKDIAVTCGEKSCINPKHFILIDNLEL